MLKERKFKTGRQGDYCMDPGKRDDNTYEVFHKSILSKAKEISHEYGYDAIHTGRMEVHVTIGSR